MDRAFSKMTAWNFL